MTHKGWSHVGVSTLDMDKTRMQPRFEVSLAGNSPITDFRDK